MATNESYVGTSHNLLNYAGVLFNKGGTATPFLTLIGGKSRTVQNWAFPTSLAYTTGGGSSQPAITETASLTAPNAEFLTRTQDKNYVQIFQRAISLSYGKLSSMDQLSGLNIAGQSANPANEFDFQVANALKAMQKDVEYTFINGAGQDGNYDDVAYKSKGIINAISTNAITQTNKDLGFWIVADALKTMAAANAEISGLVLMINPVQVMQFNADCAVNGLTIVPAGRNVNGINIATIETPFGSLGILPNSYVPAGTALIVNPAICAPVMMPVPNKGNFFVEELAKTGAANKYQLYGQCGLDYGAEWYHAKITGLNQTFTAPTASRIVSVASSSSAPVYTSSVITNTTAAPVNTKEVTG